VFDLEQEQLCMVGIWMISCITTESMIVQQPSGCFQQQARCLRDIKEAENTSIGLISMLIATTNIQLAI
jgi:hypothetical protein